MPTRRAALPVARVCAGCGRRVGISAGAWCTHCRDRWGTVPGWWEPEPGGVVGWSAARYGGPVRRAVLQGKRGAGEGLVELLLERLPRECMPRGAVVTWIPAHPRRSIMVPDVGASLARALAEREDLAARRLLHRVPWARRQAGEDRDTRRAQGHRLGLRVRFDARVAPPAVVLVDDVRTTGATLDRAAELLREAGTRHVIGVTVALAGST